MKRLHVHVSVEDLDKAIGFYSALFATQPSIAKPDYAKWMLDDPRVNCAISTRGRASGLDHLGIQVESTDELHDVYARLRKAGLVIVGRTNTSEFGLAPTTEPAFGGATVSPWRRDLSPGGSSGGSAAVVAAGGLPMAHATDGGGSIRIPASLCGLFGLKPTQGRVPLFPPSAQGTLSHIGPMTRTVRDAAMMMNVIARPLRSTR